MHWWWSESWSWWNWALMTVGMLVFWGIVIRAFASAGYLSSRTRHPSPEQLLDERFAVGDIDADDYERRLDALHSVRSARARPRS